jgi:excisionase family DNA binding protein
MNSMKVYTAEEVAAILRVDYKTVLRLVQRGRLKVLPGIRHKRMTEEELMRYLDVRGVLFKPAQTSSPAPLPVACPPASGESIKLAENNKPMKGK